MADFMSRPEINSSMVMFLSLHSAGQYLLIPTGLNATKIPEYAYYVRTYARKSLSLFY